MKLLKNSYYGFRHGQSMANVEGIIISDPSIGTTQYGLTEEGQAQVLASISGANGLDHKSVVVSSDFKRAVETAKIIQQSLSSAPVLFDARLRERFFGQWEGQPHENYSKAWKNDLFDPDQVDRGAESTAAVCKRMWAVIESMESHYAGRRIILVSHGDPLMILQAAFSKLGPRRHRTFPYFETAEIRPLN